MLETEKKLYDITDRDVKAGRMTRQEAFCLGMILEYVKANPDGRFAEVLVRLVQGEI